MRNIVSTIHSKQLSFARVVVTIVATAAVPVLSGCPGKAIAGLKPGDCAASDIVLILSGGKVIPKAGSQHSDVITVNATCSKPAPGGPLAGAGVQVTWPSGTTSTGTTDAKGNATIGSQNFPTEGGAGTVVVSVNGSDDKSQSEKTDIK